MSFRYPKAAEKNTRIYHHVFIRFERQESLGSSLCSKSGRRRFWTWVSHNPVIFPQPSVSSSSWELLLPNSYVSFEFSEHCEFQRRFHRYLSSSLFSSPKCLAPTFLWNHSFLLNIFHELVLANFGTFCASCS